MKYDYLYNLLITFFLIHVIVKKQDAAKNFFLITDPTGEGVLKTKRKEKVLQISFFSIGK